MTKVNINGVERTATSKEQAEISAAQASFRLPPVELYQDAIQRHVDATARDKQFANGVTLASYTASTNVLWAAQATAFVAWRDAVWAYAYGEMDKVQAGHRNQPTISEIIAELPLIEWPEG